MYHVSKKPPPKPLPKPIITQPITKLNIEPPQKNKNKNKKKLLKRISDKQKLLAAVVGFIALTSIFVNAENNKHILSVIIYIIIY